MGVSPTGSSRIIAPSIEKMYIKSMAMANKIKDVFKQHGLLAKYRLKNVGIFGSSTRSDEPNDIDLIISDFEDYHDLIGLREELEMRTGKKVDLVIQKHASPIIVRHALEEAVYVA
jgi:predicted nucleotidyltransferase